jgi:dipeptidyl-peptidase-4
MKKLLILAIAFLPIVVQAQKQITVEDFTMNNTFYEETIASLNWMNDGQYYSALENNSILRYDVTTGESDSVIFEGSQANIIIDDYEFSADEKKLLLLTEKESIYRRSFTAEYYIYSFEGTELNKLSKNGRQSYAEFSPDNSMIAFTRDNNLFYTKLVNMSEYAVTDEGKFGGIINGSSDWVYEEELYLTKAFEWSPDGKKLAFYRFDETNVKEYNLQYWAEGALYPYDYRYKYPKAGEENAKVEIFIHHLKDNKKIKVDLGKETDIYVPKIQWTKNPNVLSVQKLNRLQNKLNIYHANALSGKTVLILYDPSKTYLNVTYTQELIYLNNKTQFVYSTERDGYKHYYLHNMDGQLVSQITNGNWEAEKLVGIDQSKKTPVLYYISTEDSPLERHLYSVDLYGKRKTKLSQSAGTNSVDMSKDFKYYITFNTSINNPKSAVLMAARGNKVIDTLINNAVLIETAKSFDIQPKEFFTFNTIDKTELNGYFLRPAGIDSTKKYPVLIFQYSGPGSQSVVNTWAGRNDYFHQMLVQKGYIIAVIDNRGTGGRGAEFKKMTYKKMGQLEAEDHVAGAKFLATLPFIDGARIGIWGWSYGGYMASLAMMRGEGIFKAGIAVAPFTWKYYDTIYSERYLQRPQDNPDGYSDNSIITNASKLQGNFLLVHGTGDDNVHYQISMELVNKLVDSGKQFQSFFYPDKAHGIRGEKTRTHLFKMMTNFLTENL